MPKWFGYALAVTMVSEAAVIPGRGADWPSFRGPQASGVAADGRTPEKWTTNLWKTAIPGLGHSCPIVWGNHIFLTTAHSDGEVAALKIGLYGDIAPVAESAPHNWSLYCLDKHNGRVVWQRVARQGTPKIKRHPKSSHANSTPATDGRYVVAFFGAEGIFCYDFDGNLRWQKELGPLDAGYYVVPGAQWGFGSSPVIHSNRVYVQCDVQTNSFIAAFDLETGRELWRTPRTDVPTWSTPTVDVRPGRAQVIANGYKQIAGYDLLTGKQLWSLREGGDIPVPTPVVAHDLIFVTSAHGRLSPVYAIRADAQGDISLAAGETNNASIPWSRSRGGNYMQTPIVVGEHLYLCRDNGVVTCLEAATGRQLYQERLGSGRSGFTASPVAADGKLYYPSEEGVVYVLRAGPVFGVMATNILGETCMATPAISEGKLYFRTRHHLTAVGH